MTMPTPMSDITMVRGKMTWAEANRNKEVGMEMGSGGTDSTSESSPRGVLI